MTSPPKVPEPPPKSHTTDEQEEAKKPKLDPLEENKARQEESLDQKITYDVIRREGDKELERPLTGLLWAAVAGGLSMGFTFLTEGLLRSHLPDAEWRPLITKLGYPVGFLIITLGSQQLFTENTITPIVPLMVSYTSKKMRKLVSLQAVALAGNILGAFLFALAVAKTNVFEPKAHVAFNAIGLEALRHGFLIVSRSDWGDPCIDLPHGILHPFTDRKCHRWFRARDVAQSRTGYIRRWSQKVAYPTPPSPALQKDRAHLRP